MSYNYYEPPSHEIISGRSFIKRNISLEINLKTIRSNKLTILNHICSEEATIIAEAIPPEIILIQEVQEVQEVQEGTPPSIEDLNMISEKKVNSIYTSSQHVHR
jgi:hypothetical protein